MEISWGVKKGGKLYSRGKTKVVGWEGGREGLGGVVVEGARAGGEVVVDGEYDILVRWLWEKLWGFEKVDQVEVGWLARSSALLRAARLPPCEYTIGSWHKLYFYSI